MKVDLLVLPICLRGWDLAYHLAGPADFDLADQELFQSADQVFRDAITGREMFCCKLIGKYSLNASCIEPLLQDNTLVPKSWKKRKNGNICRYFFFGSLFWHRYRKTLIVLYIYWDGEAWSWHHQDLSDVLGSNDFVVLNSTLK